MRTIRKAAPFVLLLLLIPALRAETAWADLIDPCDSTGGPGSYQNLAPADEDYIRWDDPPDRSYLCQQSNRRAASVVYRCDDAREVTVAIYSRYGSYADDTGDGLTRGGEELPLWYQASTGEVYCDGRRMVYDAQTRKFVFLEEESRPSGLTRYGLSVYCSEDGTDYTQVSTRLVSARREGPGAYWYEVYRADLEEGTRWLRLVLTDQSSIEILDREERYQFETTGGLSLASVEIVEEESRETFREDRWETDRNALNIDEEYDDWEDWGSWAAEEDGDFETGGTQGTGGLPSYLPGEEEGPETLPWGPDEEAESGRPAFPEEEEDREGEPEPEAGASKKAEASSKESPAASSKAQPRQKQSFAPKSQEAGSDEAAPEEVQTSVGPVEAAQTLRREVPLWRRVTEPDAMTMVILSLTLIAIGIRVLWEDGGSRERYGKREELAEREARYARYTGCDNGARPSDRREQRPRRGQGSRYDQDREDPREEPDDWL